MSIDRRGIGKRTACGPGGRLRIESRAMQLGKQQIVVRGKSRAGMEKLVKSADERFVVEAQPPDNSVETPADLMRVLLFKVIVEKDDHRQGKRLGGEDLYFLFDIILKHPKFVAPQVRNHIAGAVLDGDR